MKSDCQVLRAGILDLPLHIDCEPLHWLPRSRPVSFGFVAYGCQLEVSLWAVHCEHGLLTLGTWHASLQPGLQGHDPWSLYRKSNAIPSCARSLRPRLYNVNAEHHALVTFLITVIIDLAEAT